MSSRFQYTALLCFYILISSITTSVNGQVVDILSHEVDAFGQVNIEIESSADKYYILKARHSEQEPFSINLSMTIGENGTTVIKEQLGAYPIENYQVHEFYLNNPGDIDGDGYDDLTEYQNLPAQSPFSRSEPMDIVDAAVAIDNTQTFNALSTQLPVVQFFEFLNGKEFLKFIILDFYSDTPSVYFMNSETHWLHSEFADWLGVDYLADDVSRGNVVFHPTIPSSNGTLGTFAFNYSNNGQKAFGDVQRTNEILAANMPVLRNNLAYFVTLNNEDGYYWEEELYENSRVSVILESDVYSQIDYLGLNLTEGYGKLRYMSPDEIPSITDIVIYETAPNFLPRVSGIITSEIQTPLSHVNLRAIQDDIPNAFIRDAVDHEKISSLIGDYVYFRAEQDGFILEEASIEEVNNWFENIRPSSSQEPLLNLAYKAILPLSEINFEMHDGFGAKCANLATMHSFGFPSGTIPNGYGVPFYFYKEFMEYNGFFSTIEKLLQREDFQEDRELRNVLLAGLRESIKAAPLPEWMREQLSEMQDSFPEGTSIRCRSSTNNEDLPGFSGAGLYESKTQHPWEGHIEKSIKQVYASIWNLRAFEERAFYKVNHFNSSMAVLCHPNYSNEKVNGVGVSADPVYGTDFTFYLNSQKGEDLVTNPPANTKPEEILLDEFIGDEDEFYVIQRSNLVPPDSLLMGPDHLAKMRVYLSKIHDEFEKLYNAERNPSFAVDIEYKIDENDQLVIKQARPWVTYDQSLNWPRSIDAQKLFLYPNPSETTVSILCEDCGIRKIEFVNSSGITVFDARVETDTLFNLPIDVSGLPGGIYIVTGFNDSGEKFTGKFLKL